tara:strand:+ start:16347 stop:16517 length:171 start_codon:yes stop_codon:yes gene_type:complete
MAHTDDHFEITEEEIAVNQAIGKEQLEMINRLVAFVNKRLDEIEELKTDVQNLKTK